MASTRFKIAAALGVVAIVTLLVVQHQALERVKAEAAELSSQAAEAESLRAENARLAKIETEAKDLPRLRAEESELLKLRGEVNGLRQGAAANSALRQRLEAAQADAQAVRATAQAQSAQLAAANTALSRRPEAVASYLTCVANLKQIDGAKEAWGLENKKKIGDTLAMTDLVPAYLKTELKCPAGNTSYNLNALGLNPTCPNYDAADAMLSLHMLPSRK